MPPKKSAGSSGDTALIQLLQATGIKRSEEISDSLLRTIYRLEDNYPIASTSGTSRNSTLSAANGDLRRPAIHNSKACQNAWLTPDTIKVALARDVTNNKGKSTQSRKLKHAKDGEDDVHPVLDPLCTPAHCRDNPRCLNWLGQALWEDTKAFSKFSRVWGLSDNPGDESRDPNIPVGLKNLGATCYVNSYLQVWFQDEPFRRGVFECALDPIRPLTRQPLYHLQVIFAALQEAPVRAFSPQDLVESLNIDTNDQQDAQEFAKLLMTLLENEFAKQPNPYLKTFIASQFEGKMMYGTQCMSCKRRSENTSGFKELEIPLKNNKSLQEQLKQSLEPEELNGENRYHCDTCGRLRNAQRYTEIVELPPVLHFSLMRFGYDFKADERKKSNAAIRFPKAINMAQYMPTENEPMWYDLKGILSHKGTSAYHGHYIAEIYDSKYASWFRFDDDTVEMLELETSGEKAPKRPRSQTPTHRITLQSKRPKRDYSDPIDVGSSDSSEDGPFVRSGPYRPSKLDSPAACTSSSAAKHRRIISESDTENDRLGCIAFDEVVKSKDAYMLVYVRQGRENKTAAEDPVVPPLARQKLVEIDCDLTTRLNKYTAEEKQCLQNFEGLRDQKRSVYQVWDHTVNEEANLLIDREALQAWLTAEILLVKKSEKTDEVKCRQGNSSDSSDCVAVTSVRSPSKTAYSRPSRGACLSSPTKTTTDSPKPQLVDKGKGRDVDRTLDAHTGDKHFDETAGPKSRQTSSSSHTLVEDISRDISPMTSEGFQSAARPSNGVHRDSYKSHPDQSRIGMLESIQDLDSPALRCPHGNLCLTAASRVKRISPAGVEALLGVGVQVLPELTSSDSLCRLCVWEPYQDRNYSDEHRSHVNKFKSLMSGQSNPSWISASWLEDWQKDSPIMHAPGTASDPPPDSSAYVTDVICQHSLLQPDEGCRSMVTGRQADFLRGIFPTWAPVPHDHKICHVCREAYQRSEHRRQELVQEAKRQKADKDLRRIGVMHDFKQFEITASRQGDKLFAVPNAWLSAWRTWMLKPTIIEQPGRIDLRAFICAHNCLVVDFNFADDRKQFELVFEHEWYKLNDLYRSRANHDIVMQRLKGRYVTEPAVCEPCRLERRTQFEEITIRLDFLLQEDLDGQTGLPITAIDLDDPADTHEDMPLQPEGVRRSSRARKAPGSSLGNLKQKARRSPMEMPLRKAQTLKDIRVQIEARTKTPVIYQRVFFKGREIEDAAETVESIGITQGEALQVYEMKVDEDSDVDMSILQDHIPSHRSRSTSQKNKPKPNGRAEGFGGTALSGLDAMPSTSHEEQLAEIAAALPGRCRACTFENDTFARVCDMCEAPL